MTALLLHVGRVHRWVAEIVTTGATEMVKRSPADVAAEPGAALAWYEEGLAGVVGALGNAGPDARVWNWFDRAPAPVQFWHRRMAQETAVHRWDGEAADAAGASPIAAELAVDGIDEYLAMVNLWLARTPVAGFAGSLHLHATDVAGEWSLTLAPDHVEHTREHTKADAALRGSASDLLLWATNRKACDAGGLEPFGDRAIIEAWRQLTF